MRFEPYEEVIDGIGEERRMMTTTWAKAKIDLGKKWEQQQYATNLPARPERLSGPLLFDFEMGLLLLLIFLRSQREPCFVL